jgi:ATP-dependent Clp protease ATP-binding subunit ClpA
LTLAGKEADRLNHNFLGTEHLLLGLIKLNQGVAVNVLHKLGLNLETVRLEIEKQISRGPDPKMIGNIPCTPRVKKVIALAQKEAKNLGHTYVGTEHLLLGLLREGDGVAVKMLRAREVDIEQTRREILKELDPVFTGLPGAESKASAPPENIAQQTIKGTFTPRAQQVLQLARKEADRLYHNFLGTEHLMLGLIKLGQGIAATRLLKLGLDLETARQEVESESPRGPEQPIHDNIPYTPRLKKVLAFANEERHKLNHTYLGTEHLLLGLLHEKEGVVAKIFIRLKINMGQVRQDILRELSKY